MSIAKQIIYGSVSDVANYVKQGAKIDEIDEYGYTPLVETAIVNDIEKTRVLLEANADVNFSDLTGRTALHWAADNNNIDLARLLLQYHANANAYTRSGQPILTMPYLRNQSSMKQLLYQYKADLSFTQDFINAKLLGHRFALEGRVDIVDNTNTFFEIEFEGFYLEFSLAILLHSLSDFKNNYAGKHLRHYFGKISVLIDALQVASELIRYQHYLVDLKQHEKKINELLRQSPLIIPVAYEGHAICLIKYEKWLIRCDRGEFGRENGTIIFYRVKNTKALDNDLIKFLLYKRQHANVINQSLIEHLDLQSTIKFPIPPQTTGNCAWANVEATIPAMIYLLLLDDAKREAVVDMQKCQQDALQFFAEWEEWDKNRALYFCIESFYRANKIRKASKAAILAAILFQQLSYENTHDQRYADKILRILTLKEYQYILKSYVKVFSEDKNNKQLKNLLAFLDDFGIDVDQLT